MKKLFIFDMDFTLIDCSPAILKCSGYAFARLGYTNIAPEDMLKTVGLTLRDSYTAVTGDSEPRNRDEFYKLYEEMSAGETIKSTVMLPGAVELLRRIKQNGCLVAVVSTKHRARITGILKRFALDDCVAFTAGADDVDIEKPHPEGVLRALKTLNTSRSEAAYVGDSATDAQTARNSGIDFYGVLTGPMTREQFSAMGEEQVFDDLFRLSEYIFGR